MFNNLRIGSEAKSAKKFTPVHPNPTIGRSHGISLMLHGKHSEQFRNAVASSMRRLKNNNSLEDSIDESAKLVVACCTGWDGVTEEGKDKLAKYSSDKLFKILIDDDFRWLRLGAEEWMRDDSNFFTQQGTN